MSVKFCAVSVEDDGVIGADLRVANATRPMRRRIARVAEAP